MYKILVPVDFSEKSKYAVKMAAKIGKILNQKYIYFTWQNFHPELLIWDQEATLASRKHDVPEKS